MNKKIVAIVLSCVMILTLAMSAIALDVPQRSTTELLKDEKKAAFTYSADKLNESPFGTYVGNAPDKTHMTMVQGQGPAGEDCMHFTGSGLEYLMLGNNADNYANAKEIAIDVKSTSPFTFGFKLEYQISNITKSTDKHVVASTGGAWQTVVIPMSAFVSPDVPASVIQTMKSSYDADKKKYEPLLRFVAEGADVYLTNYRVRWYETSEAMDIIPDSTICKNFAAGAGASSFGAWSGTLKVAGGTAKYNPAMELMPGYAEDGVSKALFIGGVPNDSKRFADGNDYTYAGCQFVAPDNLKAIDYYRVKYASNKGCDFFLRQEYKIDTENSRTSGKVNLASTGSGDDMTNPDHRVWKTIFIPISEFDTAGTRPWIHDMVGKMVNQGGTHYQNPANLYRFEGMKWGNDSAAPGVTIRKNEGVIIESIDAIRVNKLPYMKTLTLSNIEGPSSEVLFPGTNTLKATFETEALTQSTGTVFVAAMYRNDPVRGPRIVSVDMKTITVPANKVPSAEYSMSFTTPPDIDEMNMADVYIKFMVWRSADSMDQLLQVGYLDLFGVEYR